MYILCISVDVCKVGVFVSSEHKRTGGLKLLEPVMGDLYCKTLHIVLSYAYTCILLVFVCLKMVFDL